MKDIKTVILIFVGICLILFGFWSIGKTLGKDMQELRNQKESWLNACEADGNKRYECIERWELMS